MARTITHSGYTIQSTPRQTDGGKWLLHIRISRKDHQGVRTSAFAAQVLCASEQEADIHGIAFGQRIIDGKVKGMSVIDLKPGGSSGDARHVNDYVRCLNDWQPEWG